MKLFVPSLCVLMAVSLMGCKGATSAQGELAVVETLRLTSKDGQAYPLVSGPATINLNQGGIFKRYHHVVLSNDGHQFTFNIPKDRVKQSDSSYHLFARPKSYGDHVGLRASQIPQVMATEKITDTQICSYAGYCYKSDYDVSTGKWYSGYMNSLNCPGHQNVLVKRDTVKDQILAEILGEGDRVLARFTAASQARTEDTIVDILSDCR